MGTTPADLAEMHRMSGEWFARVLGRVSEDAWAAPTPCSEWDVRALVNHVVAENLWVPPLLAGETIAEVGDRFDGDVLGDDPLAAYARSIEEADTAVSEPDALERPVAVSYGPVPGADFIGHRVGDLVIHGWDLAAAIGEDRTIPLELAEPTWEEVESSFELFAASGMFGSPELLDEDVPLQRRLLVAVGRDPDWQAPR